MSAGEVQLRLQTQEAAAILTMPLLRINRAIRLAVEFELVTGISDPAGQTHTNHNQSHFTNSIALGQETPGDSITLPGERADRLINLFNQLRPGHKFQCHNLVDQMMGWDESLGADDEHALRIVSGSAIKAGSAYAVLIQPPGESGWKRTHSCIGTDRGRLLSILGRGLPLATMDPRATTELYAKGYPAGLAESFKKPTTSETPSSH